MLQDRPFDVFVYGYIGHHFLMACEDFMDHAAGRWAPNRQMYGHAFTGIVNASWQNTYDYLAVEADPHMSIITVKNSCIPPMAVGVGTGRAGGHPLVGTARACRVRCRRWNCATSAPAPTTTRASRGVEKQTLLNQGGTTITVDDNHTCRIDRVRTLRKIQRLRRPRSFVGRRHHHVPSAIFCAADAGAHPRCLPALRAVDAAQGHQRLHPPHRDQER